MEYLRDRLMRESVAFLELCQNLFLKGEINDEEYHNLSVIKINFIHDILRTERKVMFIDKDLRTRINKIYIRDFTICNSNKNIVGE